MPGLVRKLLIFAAVDGLILQPAPPRNHPPTTQQAIKIDWKGGIAPLLKDRREEDTKETALEVFGILGLLKIASSSFLVSIASRDLVAQVRGKPIYVITDVALIPLSSQEDANGAIVAARENLKRKQRLADIEEDSESELDEEEDDDGTGTVSDVESLHESIPDQPAPLDTGASKHQRRTSVAEDVIEKKGKYGRFVGSWFSKKGWSTEKRRNQGMSTAEDVNRKGPQDAAQGSEESLKEQVKADQVADESGEVAQLGKEPLSSPEEVPKALEGPTDQTTLALLPKLLRTTKLYFGSRNFYYSYDFDLSRRLDKQTPASSLQPLFQQYDPLFFWNAHLIQPFISAGQHSFVVPAIQGFVGQRAFTIDVSSPSSDSAVLDSSSKPEDVVPQQKEDLPSGTSTPKGSEREEPGQKDFLLTLISRRSVKRAGLRYLRRGVDEEGNVANQVESEQLLSTPTWDTTQNKIFSYTQVRGSIPLFFQQSPYSLKPWPVTYGSLEANEAAFKLHFNKLAARYGGVQVTSLVDKHGSEAKIGELFEKHAKRVIEGNSLDKKDEKFGFEWFDFHNVCRGMRFENVSILMDTLKPTLDPFGWTIQDSTGFSSIQSGILRTNCMDCLDRTNVVQSATGRAVLEAQLAAQNIKIDLQTDPKTAWFNTLWADNGDAISKQYAGTAALKGDYTRTRRRQISGALTDFGLTLSRYYNNIVNDYFAQAMIDYLLGRATESIFTEFEADMKSQDYAIDLRKVRQTAIQRSAELIIDSPHEDLIGGWTLSCPAENGTIRSFPFEECVLLLTEKALYFCRLDWTTEKVKEFERLDLAALRAIRRGAYITSTLAQRDMDEEKNVGFVLEFTATKGKDLIRVNTRSLDNAKAASPTKDKDKEASSKGKKGTTSTSTKRILAFKALPPKTSYATVDGEETQVQTERQSVDSICAEISRAVNQSRGSGGRTSSSSSKRVAGGRAVAAAAASPSADEREQQQHQQQLGQQEEGGGSGKNEDEEAEEEELKVEDGDVISLADARKATGYLEQLGYSIKKLVWA